MLRKWQRVLEILTHLDIQIYNSVTLLASPFLQKYLSTLFTKSASFRKFILLAERNEGETQLFETPTLEKQDTIFFFSTFNWKF